MLTVAIYSLAIGSIVASGYFLRQEYRRKRCQPYRSIQIRHKIAALEHQKQIIERTAEQAIHDIHVATITLKKQRTDKYTIPPTELQHLLHISGTVTNLQTK